MNVSALCLAGFVASFCLNPVPPLPPARGDSAPDAPTDLPPVVAAPPLSRLRAEFARAVNGCERVFQSSDSDNIFYFRGGALRSLSAARPYADTLVVDDARLASAEIDARLEVSGRELLLIRAGDVSLLVDTAASSIRAVTADSSGRAASPARVGRFVVARGDTVLCTVNRNEPGDGWARLDVATGVAHLFPADWVLEALDREGAAAVFAMPRSDSGGRFTTLGAVDIASGEPLEEVPDGRTNVVAAFDWNEVPRFVSSPLPLVVDDGTGSKNVVGIRTVAGDSAAIDFPRRTCGAREIQTHDEFISLVPDESGADGRTGMPTSQTLWVAPFVDGAGARRVARNVASHALFGRGHCAFVREADKWDVDPLVYSYERDVVWRATEGVDPRVPAVDRPFIVPHERRVAVARGAGSPERPTWWGYVTSTHVGYDKRQLGPYSGTLPNRDLASARVLVSPGGERYLVEGELGPRESETFFNAGTIATFSEEGERGRRSIKLFAVKLPVERLGPVAIRPGPVAVPKLAGNVLESADYFPDEVAGGVDGEWLGLFRTKEGAEVRVCRPTVRTVFKGLTPAKDLLRVDSGDAAREIFLFRDIAGKRPGPVPTATKPDEAVVRPSNPGGFDASFDGQTFRVEIDFDPPAGASDATSADARGYSAVLVSGSVRQTLERFDAGAFRGEVRLLWAGDLDDDGRLDLYVMRDLSDDVRRQTLFLSSLAAPGALVGEAGRLEAEFATLHER